jgi:hypothetical protein
MNVPIPMTNAAFYSMDKTPLLKSAQAKIARKYRIEIQQAEHLTKVPGAIILAVIFAESAGDGQGSHCFSSRVTSALKGGVAK